MPTPPLFLGVNAAYHETAAALVRGGQVLFAVEEERLTRVKHGKRAHVSNPDALPWAAIGACLEAAGAKLGDLAAVGYSLEPGGRLRTVGEDPLPLDTSAGFGTPAGEEEFEARVRSVPGQFPVPVQFIPHHLAHAASAFYPSPFESAAVLVVDGIGEASCAWLGRGGPRLRALEEVPYPHSLGLLWERVSVYLGFDSHDAPKVMGLAAFGEAGRFAAQLEQLIAIPDPGGGTVGGRLLPYQVELSLARLRSPGVEGLERLFGPRRRAGEEPTLPRFAAVAAALQRRTEEALLALCRRLFRATGERALVCAGGVALNCVANARLEREGPFEQLHIAGPAHDAGTALGAALELAGQRVAGVDPFLGPEYPAAAQEAAVARAGLKAARVADPPEMAAELLSRGKLVGWFQGRLELGPRALGHRSLLGDPRDGRVREELNRRVKHREAFRPFGASICLEALGDWFELPDGRAGAASCRELMLVTYPVRPKRAAAIPAALHCDGSCRLQVVGPRADPAFHRLIQHFGALTGVPLVLNTSFNDDEPIVCSPDDALATFRRGGVDALFLGDLLVRR